MNFPLPCPLVEVVTSIQLVSDTMFHLQFDPVVKETSTVASNVFISVGKTNWHWGPRAAARSRRGMLMLGNFGSGTRFPVEVKRS